MKIATSVMLAALVVAAAGSTSAQPRDYRGAETLDIFIEVFIERCGAVGGGAPLSTSFGYNAGGSSWGGHALMSGSQDVAPMSRPLSALEACDTTIPPGPEEEAALTIAAPGSRAQSWAVALDGIAITTSLPSAARCDTSPTDDDGDGESGINVDGGDFGASLVLGGSSVLGTFLGARVSA